MPWVSPVMLSGGSLVCKSNKPLPFLMDALRLLNFADAVSAFAVDNPAPRSSKRPAPHGPVFASSLAKIFSAGQKETGRTAGLERRQIIDTPKTLINWALCRHPPGDGPAGIAAAKRMWLSRDTSMVERLNGTRKQI